MERCLQLAKNGLGSTYPNPLVGAVVVCDNKIIGEGWHRKAGGPHAEVHAINSVSDKNILQKATIYVSLEPCSHYGKTPPCSDLIISSEIKKVVIGSVDPFKHVAGKGIKKLLDAGCEVRVGVLEKKCAELNKRFFTFHTQKRPFIILKWAQSADGFIAPDQRMRGSRSPVWITNTASRQLVHKWRAEEMAILVGTSTVEADNPSLTTREWWGSSPTRIVLDRKLRLDPDSAVFNDDAPTFVITEKAAPSTNTGNVNFLSLNFQINLAEQLANALYESGLQSVIIEGGKETLQTFIDNGLWDEARVFTGSVYFKNGVPAPRLAGFKRKLTTDVTGDQLSIFHNV